jgi:SAM-dependent methyltransferase
MVESGFWQIVAHGLLRSEFEWLQPLKAFVSCLIVFGCWDDGNNNRGCREAYVLLRTLEAIRAVVVDKEAVYIRNAHSWFQDMRTSYPELLGAYELEFVVSDMSRDTDDLPRDSFDLAYCSGVLYFMKSDAGKLQAAVNTMARVIRVGGWVIANEDKGLHRYFKKAGLTRSKWLDDAPKSAYCYRKLTCGRKGT